MEEKKHVVVRLNDGQMLKLQMTHAEYEKFLSTIKDHKEEFAHNGAVIIRKSEIVYVLMKEATRYIDTPSPH